ncbi:Adhesion G-protein coupled receptor D1 [Trichoplax sp. H2]|nr:Adhesion G-protein coupled receptor D1 [Trichoplax sp. H2]|eukprot:RDD47837.1 Adhesion G-protein coupled receptor D1 [Trichoplax sp. H2]
MAIKIQFHYLCFFHNSSATAGIEEVCPADWVEMDGLCYKGFKDSKLNFFKALAACKNFGGILAKLDTLGKTLTIVPTLNTIHEYWIGLRNYYSYPKLEKFKWIVDNSSSNSFNNWGVGDPTQTEQQCVIISDIYRPGQWLWYHRDCAEDHLRICQVKKDVLLEFLKGTGNATVSPSPSVQATTEHSTDDGVSSTTDTIQPATSSQSAQTQSASLSTEATADTKTVTVQSTTNSQPTQTQNTANSNTATSSNTNKVTMQPTTNSQSTQTQATNSALVTIANTMQTTTNSQSTQTKTTNSATVMIAHTMQTTTNSHSTQTRATNSASTTNANTMQTTTNSQSTQTQATNSATATNVNTNTMATTMNSQSTQTQATNSATATNVKTDAKQPTTNTPTTPSKFATKTIQSTSDTGTSSIAKTSSNPTDIMHLPTTKPPNHTVTTNLIPTTQANIPTRTRSPNTNSTPIPSTEATRSNTAVSTRGTHQATIITTQQPKTVPTRSTTESNKSTTATRQVQTLAIKTTSTTQGPTRATARETTTLPPHPTTEKVVVLTTQKMATTKTVPSTTQKPSTSVSTPTSATNTPTTATELPTTTKTTAQTTTNAPTTATTLPMTTITTPKATTKSTTEAPTTERTTVKVQTTSSTAKVTINAKVTTSPAITIATTNGNIATVEPTVTEIQKDELSQNFQSLYPSIQSTATLHNVSAATNVLSRLNTAFNGSLVNGGDLVASKDALIRMQRNVNVTHVTLEKKVKFFNGFYKVLGSMTSANTVSAWHNASKRFAATSVMLKLTDDISQEVGKNLQNGQSFVYNSSEIRVKIQKSNATALHQGGGFRLSAEQRNDNYFVLPPTAADQAKGSVTVIGGIYPTLQYLPNSNGSATNRTNSRVEIVNSYLISCSMTPAPYLTSDKPFTFMLTHTQTNLSASYKPTCAFWNFTTSSWSNEGCEIITTNSTHTQCKCVHLTHFAILMRVTDTPISQDHARILTIITYVVCSLSIFGTLASIVVFLMLRLTSDRYQIHMNLGISLLLAQIGLLLGDAVKLWPVPCKFLAIYQHFFFLAIFSWMLVEGIHLYFQIVTVFETKSKTIIYYSLGWGIPLIITIISVAVRHQDYGTNSVCWLSVKNGLIWAFVAPAIVIISINTLILATVVRIVVGKAKFQIVQKNQGHWKSFKSSLRAVTVLLPLLGLTWLFGLLSVDSNTIVFSYIFVIFNGLQGFFFFLFHCCFNSEIKSKLARQSNKFSYESSSSGSPLKTMKRNKQKNLGSRSRAKVAPSDYFSSDDINSKTLSTEETREEMIRKDSDSSLSHGKA